MPPRPLTPADRVTSRLIGLAVMLPLLGLLITAAVLRPSSEGLGTHTQLGLPPCGFEVSTGLPCATCGMTTAFSYAADGRLWMAFTTQPAGALLALLSAMGVWLGGWAAVRGMPLAPLAAMLLRPRVWWSLLVVVLGSWLYTAARVMNG